MKSLTQCLQTSDIDALLAGTVPASQCELWEEHFSFCESCRIAMESQVGDQEWWREAEQSLVSKSLPEVRDSVTNEADERESIEDLLKLLGPTDDPQMLGRIGSYEVLGLLGRGGMGVVFKAFDAPLNRFVAIKMLLPHLAASGAARKRFAREGQAVAAVFDDHVMAIHCVDEWQSVPYLVMTYSRGVSLQKRLSDSGPLEVREILRIGMQAAKGLAAAHAQGIVHRDIKPANIFLDQNVQRVQLMDFGLARAVDDASLTRSGTIAGTPQYMSPEQARAESVDHRSDLFSLGSVMYAMCTGRAPFRAESSYSVLRLITDKEPRPIREINSDIPEWLCAIISKLMAKQASDRFASAQEVAKLLEACLAHVQQPTVNELPGSLMKNRLPKPGSSRPAGLMQRFKQFGVRGWLLAGISITAFTLVAMMLQDNGPDRSGQGEPGPLNEATGTSDCAVVMVMHPAELPKGNTIQRTAATKTIGLLTANDYCGILLYGSGKSETNWLWGDETGLRQVGKDRDEWLAAIAESKTGDFPTLEPAFTMAADALQKVNARQKLMIVFTDGDPLFVDATLIDRFRDAGIKVSVIHVDIHLTKKRPLLKRLADATGGTYHYALESQASVVDTLFVREIQALRSNSRAALKKIGVAFHMIHDKVGSFPGSRMRHLDRQNNEFEHPYSWRVAILPYIGQQKLFDKYRFDEPWDSDNNAALLKEMPDLYRSPHAPGDQHPGNSNMLGFATKRGGLGLKGGEPMSSFTDGTSNTILIVETAQSVPWTKPEDLTEPRIQPIVGQPLRFVLADGSVAEMNPIDADRLEKMITRNGGEIIGMEPVHGQSNAVKQLGQDKTPADPMWKGLNDEQIDEISLRHLKAVVYAMHAYLEKNGTFPPATVSNPKLPIDKRLSGFVLLLPYLGLRPSWLPENDEEWQKWHPDNAVAKQLFNTIDLEKAWDDPVNAVAAKTIVPEFVIPGGAQLRDKQGYAVSHFAFVRGSDGIDNGAFPLERANGLTIKDFPDGTSVTLAMGQIHDSVGPWIAAGASTSRFVYHPSDKSGKPSFGGPHAGCAYVANCDGSVYFLDLGNTDRKIVHCLAERADDQRVRMTDAIHYADSAAWKLAGASLKVGGSPLLGIEPKNDRPHFTSTPASIAEWRLLESHVQKTIQKTRPAIVAVGVSSRIKDWSATFPHFEHFASGVIIRGDGLILSQWHVTHELGRGSRKPGELAEVILQDGRRLKAELLGGNQLRDISLLRLVQPGDYPHVELAENNSVSLGDWVLKLGHPMGYRASRGAVSRLGRVLFLGETIDIVADCQSAGGDSGGPLVDLDGKVVGMLGSTPQGVNFYPSTPHFASPWCYTNVATIRELMPPMLNPGREVTPQPSGSVSGERSFLTRNPVLTKDFILSDKNVGDPRIVLPLDEWRQGKKTRSDWYGLTKSVSNCVVEVLIEGHRVSLGTVVSADGWVLTKASEISEAPQCRLSNGEIVPARVISIDAAYDLAMLKLDVTGLHAVEWSRDRNRPMGTIIAALSGKGTPMAMGIISVSQRSLEGPFPATQVKAPRRGPPLPLVPDVSGQQVASKGFVVSFVQGSAAEAGIHIGDILLSIDNRPIHKNNDLASSIKGRSPGDKLHVTIEREGQHAALTLTLKSEPYSRSKGNDRMNESFRRDDFPVAFEHDIPLWLDECGGPLIGLDGKVVGMTIARVGQHGCMAIPADVIESLIPSLRSNTTDSAK